MIKYEQRQRLEAFAQDLDKKALALKSDQKRLEKALEDKALVDVLLDKQKLEGLFEMLEKKGGNTTSLRKLVATIPQEDLEDLQDILARDIIFFSKF